MLEITSGWFPGLLQWWDYDMEDSETADGWYMG